MLGRPPVTHVSGSTTRLSTVDGLQYFPCHMGSKVLTIMRLQEILEVRLLQIVNLDRYPKKMMKVEFSLF